MARYRDNLDVEETAFELQYVRYRQYYRQYCIKCRQIKNNVEERPDIKDSAFCDDCYEEVAYWIPASKSIDPFNEFEEDDEEDEDEE